MTDNVALPFERVFTDDMQHDFDKLQEKLAPMWRTIGRSNPGIDDQQGRNTNVVIPSVTVDADFSSSTIRALEERLLFLLFLLRQVNLDIIYVTSMPISKGIIDYYLGLMPDIIASHAQKRLHLIATEDASSRPLSVKLLERPWLIDHIRSLVSNLDAAHMVPYMTTDLERELALKLGIPMYAVDPKFYALGTKSGCRRLFIEEEVTHPLGKENLYSIEDTVKAIEHLRKTRPNIQTAMLKLNDASSGYGNAKLDLANMVPPGAAGESQQILARIKKMELEDSGNSYDRFVANLKQFGSIVEEYIDGEEYYSPSVQCRISPIGEVQVLSSHDQILGGPSGGIYMGAVFPANPEYSPMIKQSAMRISKRLAAEGVVGRFAIDFVVIKNSKGEWEAYAIEINLRKGGTTAPFLILQYLTDGQYDADKGVFRTAQGNPKYYVTSDHVSKDIYRVFTAEHLFNLVCRHKFHYNHTVQTGIVFHMLSGVGETGTMGITAIHNTPEQAQSLYQRFGGVLDDAAKHLSQQ